MTKNARTIGILCWLAYFASYVTRINFGAVISEIVISEGFLKSTVGMVTTASFVSYGTGQLISGYLGDRVSPKKLIFWGLIATTALNLLIPFCKSVELMSAVWFLNGFAQAMMWPPLVRIMATNLSETMYRKTSVNVSIASSVGTIVVYLMAPVCIALYGWRLVFFISAFVGLAVAAIWRSKHGAISDQKVVTEQNENRLKRHDSIGAVVMASGLLFIAAAVILQGVLKDGITTWLPSLITETYHWGSEAAILTTVVLPVFSVISVKFIAWLQERAFKNDLSCAFVLFFAGFVFCGLLLISHSKGPLLSILLAAFITACMHGVNLMLIAIVPGKFEQYGRVSTVSGILNFFAYTGSATSSYGVAKVAENFGWSATMTLWLAAALLGTFMCLLCIRRWRTFIEPVNIVEPVVPAVQPSREAL